MPILHNNRPLFRIKFKDANIREVRRGNELEWGLYEISYLNKGPSIVNVGWNYGENIPNYVWGYPNQSKNDFDLILPEDIMAAEAESILGSDYAYKTHSTGWYSAKECDELHYIPAITRDFHKDLSLFCGWKQRKYLYTGTYKYQRWVDGGGGGGGEFSPRTSIDGLEYGGYANEYYWSSRNPYATADGTYLGTNCLPNCTTYAYGRCLELGIGAPVWSARGASSWHSVTNFDVIGYDASQLEPGDIVEWVEGVHVAVYEGDGMVSASGWPSSSTAQSYGNHWGPNYNTLEKISNYWYIQHPSDAHSFNYKTVLDEGRWVGDTTPDYIIKTSAGLDGGGGGESGHWEDGSPVDYDSMGLIWACGETGDTTDGSQDDPLPSTHIHTGNPRNLERWEPLICITRCRYGNYDQNNNLKWSDWVEEDRQANSVIYFDNVPPSGYSGWLTEWDNS